MVLYMDQPEHLPEGDWVLNPRTRVLDYVSVPAPEPQQGKPDTVLREICGSLKGYYKHSREREDACDPCRAVMRQHKYQQRTGNTDTIAPAQPLMPCGTPAAYHRHFRAGEDACDPCRAAIRLANRERKRERARLRRKRQAS